MTIAGDMLECDFPKKCGGHALLKTHTDTPMCGVRIAIACRFVSTVLMGGRA
jgi:hypothetical protein